MLFNIETVINAVPKKQTNVANIENITSTTSFILFVCKLQLDLL